MAYRISRTVDRHQSGASLNQSTRLPCTRSSILLSHISEINFKCDARKPVVESFDSHNHWKDPELRLCSRWTLVQIMFMRSQSGETISNWRQISHEMAWISPMDSWSNPSGFGVDWNKTLSFVGLWIRLDCITYWLVSHFIICI